MNDININQEIELIKQITEPFKQQITMMEKNFDKNFEKVYLLLDDTKNQIYKIDKEVSELKVSYAHTCNEDNRNHNELYKNIIEMQTKYNGLQKAFNAIRDYVPTPEKLEEKRKNTIFTLDFILKIWAILTIVGAILIAGFKVYADVTSKTKIEVKQNVRIP